MSKRTVRRHSVENRTLARRSRLFQIETLESRVTPTAYTVNILGDFSGLAVGSGSGTSGDLRYCLNQAIADQQADTITFDSTVFSRDPQKTISLSASLVTKPAAFTNPYGQTSFIVGAGDDITIDGSLGAGGPGITIDGGGLTRFFAVARGRGLGPEQPDDHRRPGHGRSGRLRQCRRSGRRRCRPGRCRAGRWRRQPIHGQRLYLRQQSGHGRGGGGDRSGGSQSGAGGGGMGAPGRGGSGR